MLTNLKSFLFLMIAGAVGFALSGCAASIHPNSTVTYEHPEGVSPDTLALLPVTAGEGLEGFRRLTADSIEASIKSKRSDIVLIPADSSRQRLNEAELAETYSEMITAYQNTGVLDGETLTKMADAIGSSLMMQVKVSYATKSETGYNALTGITQTDNQSVGLFAHMWSAQQGDVAWEADAGADVSAGPYTHTRELPTILGRACSALVNTLPATSSGTRR